MQAPFRPGFRPRPRFNLVRVAAAAVVLMALCLGAPAGAQAPQSAPRTAPEGVIRPMAPASDRALADRIRTIFENIDDFREVSVAVRSGVVTLTGTVPDSDDRARAAGVAARVDGVVAIQNRITASHDIQSRGQLIYERLRTRLGEFAVSLPLLIVAVLVFVLFYALGLALLRMSRLVDRLSRNAFQKQLLHQTARAVIVFLGLILALEVLDATWLIGAVVGAAGATGIVLGFALKETIENYAAGLLLSLRQPFAPNDHIVVGDFEGHVIRLTSRATVLLTLDGNHVRIPNARVFTGTLVNYSRNPERRFEFDIGVGVDVDLDAARKLAERTLAETPGVLTDPAPDAWIDALGDSNVVLKVLGWVDQRKFSLPKVRGETIRRVKSAFEAAEFDLPEPIYRLKYMAGSETPGTPPPATRGTRKPLPAEPDRGALDIGKDEHIEREVANERARLADKDLLDPGAEKE